MDPLNLLQHLLFIFMFTFSRGLDTIPGFFQGHSEKDHAPYMNVSVDTLCKCRSICSTDVRCNSFWFVSLQEEGLLGQYLRQQRGCQLFTENCGNNHVYLKGNGAPLWCKFDQSYPNGETKADGRTYLMLTMEMDWISAKNFCTSLPGFDLANFKTLKQMKILEQYGESVKEICVDMTDFEDGDPVWGDGTRFLDTELDESYLKDIYPSQTYFRYAEKHFNDLPRGSTCSPLCLKFF